MKLHGYCTDCRRFRLVFVPAGNLWKLQLGQVEGICDECLDRGRGHGRRMRGVSK
jgi:hypothetical protein